MFEQFDPLKGKRLSVLDQDGKLLAKKWLPELSDERLVDGYKQMMRARIVDQRALGYQASEASAHAAHQSWTRGRCGGQCHGAQCR